MEDVPKSPGYTISCQNPEFQSKMHDIFAGIDGSVSNMASSDSAIESGEDEDIGDGESTSFKIPETPNNFVKPAKPDFLVNPSRYTKYSLKDTELTDNKTNSQVAFQFLQEINNRKDPTLSQDGSPCTGTVTSKKHVFKMPEHVVGEPKPKEKNTPTTTKADITSCDKVELEHLEENISAAEYTNEIAAKLDDEIAKIDSTKRIQTPKEIFKPVPKKSRRNLRTKPKEEG